MLLTFTEVLLDVVISGGGLPQRFEADLEALAQCLQHAPYSLTNTCLKENHHTIVIGTIRTILTEIICIFTIKWLKSIQCN